MVTVVAAVAAREELGGTTGAVVVLCWTSGGHSSALGQREQIVLWARRVALEGLAAGVDLWL